MNSSDTSPEFLTYIKDEIEPRDMPLARLGEFHQQLAAKQAVAAVGGLVWKIELGCQHPAAARLHLDVIVRGAAGIDRGPDGAEAVTSVGVGELMAAVAKARVVVFTVGVGVPEIDQRTSHRPAA